MRVTFAALLCSLFLLARVTAASAAPGAASATWTSTPKGLLGFGIYDKEGSCEDLRGGLPLRFGTKNLKAGASSGPLQVNELAFCLLFVSEPTSANPDGTSSCASGSVELSYDAKANEYRGKYDLTMKNKTVRRGEFRAQFCKPGEPAKNQ